MKNHFLILALLAFAIPLLSTSVSAIHNVTNSTGGSSFRFNEDTNYIYNISINNSDVGEISNITEVNITLPLSFSFISGSNGSNANSDFSNTTTVVTWINNTDYLINGSGIRFYFWFNATASTPGTYNISVSTTNFSGTSVTNLSVTILDITPPNGTISLPTSFANYSALSFDLGISATDNVAISSCWVTLTNGSYNHTMSNATDSSFSYANDSIANGTYTTKFYCNDTSNNVNLTLGTRIFSINSTIVAVDDPASPGGSTGGVNNSYWYLIYYPSDVQIKAGYNKDLATRHSIRIKINNSYYYVGVVALTSKKATINVSNASNSYQNVFEKDEEKKFDTNKDGYYEVLVRVFNVSGLRANISVQTIFEKITSTPVVNSTNSTGAPSGNGTLAGSSGSADLGAAKTSAPKEKSLIAKTVSSIWFWIVFTIIILIVAAFLYEYFLNKKYYTKGYRKKWD